MGVVGYWNGEYVQPDEPRVPLDERGHQFGDGIYEVVRVYGGRPFLLDLHLERLANSLAFVGIQNPHTTEAWTAIIHDAIARSQEPESLVYWQVTRGAAPRAHLFPETGPSVSLTVRPFSSKPASSATLLALPDERWANAFVKTINLLPNVLAKQTAASAGATEALLVRDGAVTEGSSSNAWFVKAGTLYTAPADRFILGGISRRFTLQLAEQLGLPVVFERLPWHELASVDEVFMTGSTIEVLPVSRVDVDPTMESELLQLPSQPPASLVREVGACKTVWSATGDNPVGTRLQKAFQMAVDVFRRGGS